MKKTVYILALVAFLNSSAYSQITCKDKYSIIHQLQIESNSVFRNENSSLSKRIKKSKNMAKQALKIAYETIENAQCNGHDYSIIVDRIIDLELKFGNKKSANSIALERLNKLSPNWKNRDSYVSVDNLTALSRISAFKSSDNFYKQVRKNKGNYGICGTTTYEQDVSTLLWQANQLFENYGKIYCYKLLQNSVILINEDSEQAKRIWDEIYTLLIKSIMEQESIDQILTTYANSKIIELNNKNWQYLNWDYSFKKSKYYFELYGLRIYLKTESCPKENNKFKRCEPSDLEFIKSESNLLNRIKEYAS